MGLGARQRPTSGPFLAPPLKPLPLFAAPAHVHACRHSSVKHYTHLQEGIEDTKGNNGDLGDLRVTNLRLIWVSRKSKRTNICIGHNCITSVTVKAASSRLQGAWEHRSGVGRAGVEYESVCRGLECPLPACDAGRH